MAKNIRVFLKTVQTLLISAEEDGSLKANENSLTTEFESVGTMSRKDGVFTLEYYESYETGLFGAMTAVTFNESEPDRITVTRDGIGAACLVFKPGLRYLAVYDTQYGSFEMAVVTQSAENTVGMSGGVINAVYTLEMHGMAAENTSLQITVKCEDGDKEL